MERTHVRCYRLFENASSDRKLITDIKDQPAALYDLKHDLAERHNLIAGATQAARVKAMEKAYREIRASKRSTNTP